MNISITITAFSDTCIYVFMYVNIHLCDEKYKLTATLPLV